jgi:VWFA-related protein
VRELEERLPQLAEHTTGVMVVNLGRSLTIENRFTHDVALLRDSLERIVRSGRGVSTALGRNSILRAIERAVDPRAAQGASPTEAEMILRHAEADAVQILGDIQSHVVERRLDLKNCQRRLETLVASLAGLDGRKAVLYISSGYETRLGEALFRRWWAKFLPITNRLGMNNIEPEINQQDMTHEVQNLVAHANANGAVFYALGPGIDRFGPMAANVGSATTSSVLQGVIGNEAGVLEALALGTGGLALTTSSNVDHLIDGLERSLESYYSLGYSSELSASGKRRRIKVEIDDPDLVVRYARDYLDKSSEDLMEERTLAALLLDVADNPLAIGVELGKEERHEDGKFLLPVQIKIPIANLTLLPEEDRHVARVSLVFVAQDERGTSDPVHLALPIDIPNTELLTALSRSAAYSARLTVRAGEQKLAIGVRDEIAQIDSTLNVVANVGDGASGSL